MSFPVHRPRRLRRNDAIRRLVRETRLSPDNLIAPLFVCPGEGVRREIGSMPGCFQQSPDHDRHRGTRIGRSRRSWRHPVRHSRSEGRGRLWRGRSRWAGADRSQALKRELPDLSLWADVCLCEYTDHGHCGPIVMGPDGRPDVGNDAALPRLADAALAYARAGADVVAPSDMMDGRIGAIRSALDAAGRDDVVIVSYAAKYASAFYGPFREAAGSAPAFGDRRGYQMDPANAREALSEVAADLDEGADVVMVKPALVVPRRDLACEGAFQCAGRGLQRVGRIRDGESGRPAWLAGRIPRRLGDPAQHPPRRRGHHPHVFRQGCCAIVEIAHIASVEIARM